MKKKSPTLQQIRIDKLEKEKRELEKSAFNWKVRFCIVGTLLLIEWIINFSQL